jgi:hypothetical protein
MSIREIMGIAVTSVVLIAAASGSATTPARNFRSHLMAPAGTSQVANEKESPWYEPPRSPGFNQLTGS